jgi:hypothetical protein
MENQKIIDAVDTLLFLDGKAYQGEVGKVQEGSILNEFRLIPTFIDRKSFYMTMLGENNSS